MIAAPAPVGARIVDTVHLITAAEALALKADNVDGVAQYLGSVTAEGVQGVITAGLGFFPVTYADQFTGSEAADRCVALGLPAGVDVFLDVEGIGPKLAVPDLIAEINAWAAVVKGAGYTPKLYVGANAQLTSAELYALAVVGYWKGQSRIEDRNGQLAEPSCGWQLVQGYPSVLSKAGFMVDYSAAWLDYQRRPLTWAIASPREAPTMPGRKSSGSMPAVR